MGKLRHLILVSLLRICQILLLKKQSICYSLVSNIIIKNKTFDCNALNIINNQSIIGSRLLSFLGVIHLGQGGSEWQNRNTFCMFSSFRYRWDLLI